MTWEGANNIIIAGLIGSCWRHGGVNGVRDERGQGHGGFNGVGIKGALKGLGLWWISLDWDRVGFVWIKAVETSTGYICGCVDGFRDLVESTRLGPWWGQRVWEHRGIEWVGDVTTSTD